VDQAVGDGAAGLGPGLVRTVRAALVSTVTVSVGFTCHALAGGMDPPLLSRLGVLLVAGALAFALSHWRWTVPRLSALMLAVELLVHLVCQELSPMAGMSMTGTSQPSGSRMLVWHLVGAAVSVALLRHGEDVLWSLLESLTSRGVRLLEAVVSVPTDAPSGALVHVWQLGSRLDLGGKAIRGPPG
jgi:hypothetical protein